MGNERSRPANPATPNLLYAFELTPEIERENEDQTARGAAIRRILAEAVKCLIQNVPPCPDRSAAIRKLREARMDANSAITHGGKY